MRILVEFTLEEVYDMIKERVVRTLEDHTNHNPDIKQVSVQVYGVENTAKLKFVVDVAGEVLPFNQGPYR